MPPADQGRSTVRSALRSLAREAPVAFQVDGGCMQPLLPADARVEVAARRRYWPGDVLVFEARDGRLLAHRLIGYRLRGGRLEYVTQSDAGPRNDAPFRREHILGAVVGGECRAEAYRVPLRHRLRAVWRFAGLAARSLRRRLTAGR